MELINKELEEKFKLFPIGSQDGKLGNAKVIAKFFNPTGVGTWYILEGQKLENNDYEMFGYCHLGDDELAEFGTVFLSELQNIELPLGMTIEKDLYIPKDTDLMTALKRDGIEIPEYIKEKYQEKISEIYEYESIIIATPESNIDMVIDDYKKFFESIANNVEIENLGVKKLAYEIKGLKEGNYVLFQYEADKDKIAEVERKFRIDDNIIKFITVKKEPVIDDRTLEDNEDKNTIKYQRGEIYSYEEGLKQRVQEKIVNEYNDFILELKKERPDVILERAYEKVCKQEMVYGFEKANLDTKQCKALLKCKNILSEGYSEWLKDDTNFDDNFEYAISETIKHITNNFDKEQKHKNKNAR